jgi:hypothetical protein
MHGVAGEQHAAFGEALGEQQILPPFADPLHFVSQRHGDGLFEHPRHVFVLFHHRMQREVPRVVLQDELRRVGVGDVIVPSLADRNAVEQLVAAVQRLAELQDVALALQRDAELLANLAGAAVAAGEILRSDDGGLAAVVELCRYAVRILRERDELAAIAHRHVGIGVRHRLEQGLHRVLRDELIRLERQRAVVACRDLLLRLRDRGIGQMEQRRLGQRGDDEHIHRHVRRQAGGAEPLGQPHAAEDFHGARVAALHLGQPLRRVLALDQQAADAAPAEVDGERQPHRPGADDKNLSVHGGCEFRGRPGGGSRYPRM